MAFADKLKILRKKKKWTQNDLGKKVGLHGRHIGKYETGEVMPNSETLIKLAEALGVSIDYMLLDSKGPRPEDIEDKDLLKYFVAVGRMKEEDKVVIKSLIEAYIKKNKVEAVMSE